MLKIKKFQILFFGIKNQNNFYINKKYRQI